MSEFFDASVDASTTADAEARLQEIYGDVALGGIGGYHERSRGDRRFALTTVTLEGDFEVDAETRVVTLAHSTPGYRWRSGEQDGLLSTAPALFQPEHPMSSHLEGSTTVTTVTLEVAELERLASALYGSRTPIRFDGARAVSPSAGRLWVRTVELLAAAPVLENPLSRAVAYHSLAVTALETFRLAGDRVERTASAAAGLEAYRRAAAYIDDHLSLPITEADIARAANVSERELRLVFAAHSPTGWSPAERLRQARLSAAHADLQRGDPADGDTVATIASRWGFSPSNFARRHRSVYGVNPRWVLGR